MISFVKNKIKSLDTHTIEVAKKSFSASIVKVFGIFAAIGVSIALGRTLGPEGLGVINLANQIVNLLVLLALFGMKQVVIKEVSIAHDRNDWKHIGDSMYTAYIIISITLVIFLVIFLILNPFLTDKLFGDSAMRLPFAIMLLTMIPMVFTRIHSAGLIGFRKIWQSNFFVQTLSTSVIGILTIVFLVFKMEFSIINVVIFYAIGRIIETIFVGAYWKKLLPSKIKRELKAKTLLKTALPILLVTGSVAISNSAVTIILGWLREVKEVGLFTVAARMALMTSLFLQVTNAAISPKIAALYSKKQKAELQKMVQQVTRVLLGLGFLTLVIFFFGGRWILGLWGTEFKEAYWVLVILGFGQFINLGTGAVGLLLIMTGFEQIHAKLSGIFLVITLVSGVIMINYYGIIGAALTSAFVISMENIFKLMIVKRKLGITVIGFE